MCSQNYLKSEERQAATIKSVIALAAEQNPDGITTAQIANKMGVTQGAVFRHFSTKSEIWVAVINRVTQQLLGEVENAAAQQLDPVEALRAMFTTHCEFITAQPGVPRIVFAQLQQGDSPAKAAVRSLLSRYGVVVEMQVKRGQAIGAIRPDVEPAGVASLYIGAIQGLVIRSMLSQDVTDIHKLAPGAFELIEHAIKA